MKTIVARTWHDAILNDIAFDAMQFISDGVWFHHRLNSIILIKSETPVGISGTNSIPDTEEL